MVVRSAHIDDSLKGCGAVVVHSFNVMDPKDRITFRAADGMSLRDLAPRSNLPTLCTYNGEYVHPADWELVEPSEGDYVGYLTVPKGGGNGSFQTILGVILVAVGVFVPGMQGLIGIGAALL